jgi:asparagine synthase (glutamine-hydrolysing)
MCGFVGVISENKNSLAIIKEMMNIQSHRGPDDMGFASIDFRSKQIKSFSADDIEDEKSSFWFGFNRLSILDLSINGHQPMLSSDASVVLMMNGEVYNAFDFVDDLKSKGYNFKGKSDTEVVLALYIQYGLEKMVQLLNGMFALAIYDTKLNKLFLVRDRFGIKPLYILKNEDNFAFSSEMKSFKALKNFSFELDKEGLSEYFLYRNRINKTLFKNIENLEPGFFLTYDFSNKVITRNVFYDINTIGKIKNDNYDLLDLEADLEKSVKSQLLSDVSLGSQLSGGVDSSVVTYLAAKNVADRKFKSMSVVFDNESFSEEKYVNIVGQKTDIDIFKYELNANFYIENLQKATWHFEQPINHPNTLGIFFLSKNAKKEVSVLLSGEGADELYGGYGSYIQTVLQPFNIKNLFNIFRNNGSSFFKFMKLYRSLNGRRIFTNTLGNILEPSLLYPKFSLHDATSQRMRISKKVNGSNFDKQRKYDFCTFLPDLLMRQDKMSMAFSIENRVPFLDNNLVNNAFTITQDKMITIKERKFIGKAILKKLSSKYFGDDFTHRSKQGFAIPLKDFFATKEFDTMFYEELLPSMKKRNIINVALVENYKKNSHTISQHKLEMLWVAVSFEVWAKLYLD